LLPLIHAFPAWTDKMHELSICYNILKVIVPAAQKTGAEKILEVRMNIGQLSDVIPSYLKRCFTVASAGTMAEGAILITNITPAVIHCNNCGSDAGPGDGYYCKKCGSMNIKIISGREYFIEDIKVE